MRSAAILAVALFALLADTAGHAAPAKPSYTVRYAVRFQPAEGTAAVEITTRPDTARLIGLDFDMPRDVYRNATGDGRVERTADRVAWTPPRGGGTFRYTVVVDDRRSDGAHDSLMTSDWVITRGDRLFPPARVRATPDSRSRAWLRVELPRGWTDVETPFSKVAGGDFAVTNPERRFDRPVGWIAAGTLTSTRETVAGTRVTLTAPSGTKIERVETFAILRQALPEMKKAFGELPDKLLIVRGGDPLWRGGLSAPRSLWLHADRPLLSENGTSPIVHELVHVLTDIRGARGDDWIAEGLAEFYSLEIGRRAGLISRQRFDKAIAAARTAGEHVTLRGRQSKRDRTRRAVALFGALDAELRAAGKASLDDLVRLLMRREETSLAELAADAERIEGRASKVLAEAR